MADAGLATPALTMRDQLRQRGEAAQPWGAGLNEPSPLATQADAAPPPDEFDRGDLAVYGLRSAAKSALTGIGRGITDWTGYDEPEQLLDAAAASVGPTEEQAEEAQKWLAGEDGDPSMLKQVGDAIVMEAPTLAATVGVGIGTGLATRGPVGAAVGGGVALVQGLGRMYDQATQNIDAFRRKEIAERTGRQEAEVGEEEVRAAFTPEDRFNASVAAIGGSALEVLPVTRILSKLPLGKQLVDAAVKRAARKRSLIGAAGREATVVGALGGVQEVGQELLTDLMTDYALQAELKQLPEQDLLSIGQHIAETRGEKYAVAFLAGVGLGGAAGAPGGALAQSAENAVAERRSQTLLGVAEQRGASLGALEEAAKGPRGPAFAEAAKQLERHQDLLSDAERRLSETKARSEDPAEIAALEQVVATRRAELDEVADATGAAIGVRGWMSSQELAAKKGLEDREARGQALKRLRSLGMPEGAPEAATEIVVAEAKRVGEAADKVASLESRVATIANPERRSEADEQLAVARADELEARIQANMALYGVDRATAQTDVEARTRRRRQGEARETAIARQMELEFPLTDAPEARLAKAQAMIAEAEANPAADEKGLRRKIERLANARRAETDAGRIDRITNEIADLEARIGLPTPAIEAARRVVQDPETRSQAEGAAPRPEPSSQPAAATAAAGLGDPSAPARFADETDEDLLEFGAEAGREPETETEQAPVRRIGGSPRLNQALPDLPARDRAGFAARAREAQAGGEAEMAAFADEAKRKGLIDNPKAAPALAARLVADDDADQAEAEIFAAEALLIPEDDARLEGWPADEKHPWETLYAVTGLAPTLDQLETRLRDWTELSGREASATISADGALLGVGTNRYRLGVMPPVNGFGDPTVTFTHTHTVDSPFSAADVRLMMQHGGPFRAILPNGAAIEMRRLRKITPAALDKLVRATNAAVDKRMSLDTSPLDRARIRQEALLQQLEAQGVIEVTLPFEGLTLEQREIVDDVLDETEAAARVVAGDSDGPGPEEAGGRRGRAGRKRAPVPEGLPGAEARGGRKRRAAANPERVKELAGRVYDSIMNDPETAGKITRRGRPSHLVSALKSGRLTREGLERGLAVAARSIGSKRSYVIRDMLEEMYPGFVTDPDNFKRSFAKRFTGDEGRWGLEPKDTEGLNKVSSAIAVLTAASRVGDGFFYPEKFIVKRNKDNRRFEATHHMASTALKRFLDFQGVADARLLPALDDPDDVSQVVKKPRSNQMSREQMAPSIRTAMRFQRHQYTIDRKALDKLQPIDLMSDKGLAAHGLRKDMFQRVFELRDQMRASGKKGAAAHAVLTPEDRQFMVDFGYPALQQYDAAERKLARFREAVATYEAEYPGRPIGFVYQVDDKGRIYAEGEINPQSSGAVKDIFVADGTPLRDMVTLDASASGWQIAALMARDEQFAPLVNLGKGQATEPGYKKGDIYRRTIDALEQRLRYEASRGDEKAKKALATVIEPGLLTRDMVKTPIIAVNYAATVRNFQNHMLKALPSQVGPEVARYIGSQARLALEDVAPRTMAMQNWALKTISKTVAAVENNVAADAPTTTWRVGLGGDFASKRMKTREVYLRPRSSVNILSFVLDPTDPFGTRLKKDAKGDPIIDGTTDAPEDHLTERVPVRMNELYPEGTARSIYSQIVQGFDASILHDAIERYARATGEAFVTSNHDAFTIPKENEPIMAAAIRAAMKSVMERVGDAPQRIYEDAVRNLATVGKTPEEVGITLPPERGTYELDDLLSSTPVFRDDGNDTVPAYGALPPELSARKAEEGETERLVKAEPEDDGAPGMAQAIDVANYMEQYQQPASTLRKVQSAILNPAPARKAFWQDFETVVLNGFAPIRRLELQQNGVLGQGMDSAFKSAEIATNDSGRNESLLYYGAAKYDQHGAFSVAPGTLGLNEIFRMAAGDGPERGQRFQHWMEYMVARRAEALQARGIKTPLSQADIALGLSRATPEFRAAADAWKRFNDANLDFLEQSGRISKAQKDAMQADDFYVPFYRSDQRLDGTSPELFLDHVGGGGKGVLARDPGIHKIIGGDKQRIGVLATNMIRNSQAMVAAAMRNDAANKTFDLMQASGMARLEPITSKKPDMNAVRVWRGGTEHWLVPESPDAGPVVIALAGLQPAQRNGAEQFLAYLSSIFRQSITLTPAFMLRNWYRGAVSTGLLTSGANLTLAGNSLSGFVEVMGNSNATQAFKAKSGMGDFRFGGVDLTDPNGDLLMKFGVQPKTMGYRWRKVVAALETPGTASELADRVAAYKTMVANGVREDEAAYQALTVMNYGRRGAHPTLRALLPLIPFLNAKLQGLLRLSEGSVTRRGALNTRRKAMKQLALVGSLYSMAALGIWALNASDEEDYKRYLAEKLHIRQNFDVFYVGGVRYAIPKPFEVGYVFSTLPQMLADGFVKGEWNDFLPGLSKMMLDTFTFSVVPPAFKSLGEIAANWNYFTQGAIERRSEQDLPPSLRTGGASPLAIALGKDLGFTRFTQWLSKYHGSQAYEMSPAKIEHFMQAFGGVAWGMVSTGYGLAAANLDLLGLKPTAAKRPTPPFGDIPFLSSMAADALGWAAQDVDFTKTKFVDEFWNAYDAVNQNYRALTSVRRGGDIDYAGEVLARAPAQNIRGAYVLVTKARAEMSELGARMRAIRNDPTLSAQQIEDRLRPLLRKERELSTAVVDTIRKIEAAQGISFHDSR